MRPIAFVVLATTVLAAACAPATPKPDLAAEEQAVRALDAKWNDLIASKDLDAIVALYAADGYTVWPDAPASHGATAIRAAWTELMKTPGMTGVKIVPEQITVATSGDMAFDYGHVDLSFTTPQGPASDVIKYVVGWKKVDGAWKVAYDVYNSNKPAAPPPPAPAGKGKS